MDTETLMYNRQDTLGLKTNKSITIVGCGGIGFHVAKIAAMSGIEKIVLFDPDVIEISNLNRLDVPMATIGKNKAMVTKVTIKMIRPDCDVISYPFKYNESFAVNTDWVVDCTDRMASQIENKRVADLIHAKYVKAGYNGEHMTIANDVAEWGESVDGYTITPSWAVPAIVVAALTVAKIMKYNNKEMSSDLNRLFI